MSYLKRRELCVSTQLQRGTRTKTKPITPHDPTDG
jgi:hypothetical protein